MTSSYTKVRGCEAFQAYMIHKTAVSARFYAILCYENLLDALQYWKGNKGKIVKTVKVMRPPCRYRKRTLYA